MCFFAPRRLFASLYPVRDQWESVEVEGRQMDGLDGGGSKTIVTKWRKKKAKPKTVGTRLFGFVFFSFSHHCL